VLASLGTCLFFGGISAYVRSSASAAWPAVEGVITVSEIEVRQETRERRRGTSSIKERRVVDVYEADVKYTYTVDGKGYTGDRITYFSHATDSEALAREDVEKYPVGKKVPVHHDPEDPSTAVLEPGSHVAMIIVPAVLALLLWGLAATVLYVRAAERKKKAA
jgi:hypothetical protein